MSDHDGKDVSQNQGQNQPEVGTDKFDKRADALRANLRRRKEEAKKQKDQKTPKD